MGARLESIAVDVHGFEDIDTIFGRINWCQQHLFQLMVIQVQEKYMKQMLLRGGTKIGWDIGVILLTTVFPLPPTVPFDPWYVEFRCDWVWFGVISLILDIIEYIYGIMYQMKSLHVKSKAMIFSILDTLFIYNFFPCAVQMMSDINFYGVDVYIMTTRSKPFMKAKPDQICR